MHAARQPISIRLRPEDKAFFSECAEQAGLEPSVAARQLLELFIRAMRAEGDFIGTLSKLNRALGRTAATSD